MGAFKILSGGSSSYGVPTYEIDLRQPNPDNFEVLREKQYGSVWFSIIRYPNCTNYEGKKVLITKIRPSYMKTLDPHFNEDGNIIARFRPTEEGIRDGIDFAKMKGE
ncbi:MAG: hypothetical protein CMO34_07915 [Verrucomicrobia bacterium]|nr:hypothetical protein [Verrucomicrobiota bacterium]|tara:strand:+ start:742 stop:1062 length:321 start_codon:yes stop_codon:yes gene_type:complete